MRFQAVNTLKKTNSIDGSYMDCTPSKAEEERKDIHELKLRQSMVSQDSANQGDTKRNSAQQEHQEKLSADEVAELKKMVV